LAEALLDDACEKILAQIVKMIDQADRWVIQSPKNSHTFDDPIRLVSALARRDADTPKRFLYAP
jgi:hypothetical protein